MKTQVAKTVVSICALILLGIGFTLLALGNAQAAASVVDPSAARITGGVLCLLSVVAFVTNRGIK